MAPFQCGQEIVLYFPLLFLFLIVVCDFGWLCYIPGMKMESCELGLGG